MTKKYTVKNNNTILAKREYEKISVNKILL